MSRLSILVPECLKGSYLEREPCQTEEKSGFLRGQTWMKLAEIFMEESGPPALHFHRDSFPRPSGAMSKHAKTSCPV